MKMLNKPNAPSLLASSVKPTGSVKLERRNVLFQPPREMDVSLNHTANLFLFFFFLNMEKKTQNPKKPWCWIMSSAVKCLI